MSLEQKIEEILKKGDKIETNKTEVDTLMAFAREVDDFLGMRSTALQRYERRQRKGRDASL